MLATFNEILFKMPSAASTSFRLERQLGELFHKVCLLRRFQCLLLPGPARQREDGLNPLYLPISFLRKEARHSPTGPRYCSKRGGGMQNHVKFNFPQFP